MEEVWVIGGQGRFGWRLWAGFVHSDVSVVSAPCPALVREEKCAKSMGSISSGVTWISLRAMSSSHQV